MSCLYLRNIFRVDCWESVTTTTCSTWLYVKAIQLNSKAYVYPKNKPAIHGPLRFWISCCVVQSFPFGIFSEMHCIWFVSKPWVLYWFYSRIMVHPTSKLLSWVSKISKISCQVLKTSSIIPDQTQSPVYYSTMKLDASRMLVI